MKLRLDVRRFLTACETSPTEAPAGALATADGADRDDVDLRRLPWADGSFSAIELDDVPDPADWAISGPALNECRRVLGRHGLLEIRTRRRPAREVQETQQRTMDALTRLLQNHGFEVVAVDPVDDDGAMISAMALRGDGPEDAFADEVAETEAHVTLHAPLLDGRGDSASNRALAVSLDAQGVKVRVRVIFDVLDALYCD
jgi:hypothetical protein